MEPPENFTPDLLNGLQADLVRRIRRLIVNTGPTETIERCVALIGQLHDLQERMTGGASTASTTGELILPDFSLRQKSSE
jgi:hypothetical protein